MDFIANFFTAHKDILMNPITWCIVFAVLGVIGYFLLMRESAPQKQVPQEHVASPPVDDHIMDHGDHPSEEAQVPEMDVQEEATPYDSTESQHVEA